MSSIVESSLTRDERERGQDKTRNSIVWGVEPPRHIRRGDGCGHPAKKVHFVKVLIKALTSDPEGPVAMQMQFRKAAHSRASLRVQIER